MLSNETFNASLKPDALGVWLYLLSKSEDWVIVDKHVEKHFGIGPDKRQRIFRELQDHGVMVRTPKRGKGGRVEGWDTLVLEQPLTETGKTPETVVDEISSATENGKIHQTVTVSGKNRLAEKPSGGKSPPLESTDLLPSTNSNQLSLLPGRKCPQDFDPDPEWVQSLHCAPGVDWRHEFEVFKGYTFPQVINDWHLRFKSWMETAKPPATAAGSRSQFSDPVEDLIARVRASRRGGGDDG